MALLMVPFPGASAVAMEAPEADADVEEITVVGQRSLLALRMQVEAAQAKVHVLFNELNTDDNYDIVCKTEDRYFSKTKQKICMPVYAWNAREEEAKIFLDKMRGMPVAETMSANLRIDMSEPGLKDQMIEALRNSPELFDAIVEHVKLLEELAAAQSTYFGDDKRR